jgi:hypothetical protein
MAGESFGLEAFMIIGFPSVHPESDRFKFIFNEIAGVREILPESVISVGDMVGRRGIGIKSVKNAGLNFGVKKIDGTYFVQAEVLCSKAIYEAGNGAIQGTSSDPYGLTFMDTSISYNMINPVREIIVANTKSSYFDNTLSYDVYTDREPAFSDRFTSQLL